MTIQQSVIALWKAGAKRVKLDEIKEREPIAEKRGEAITDNYPISSTPAGIRKEQLSVYSHLIITEDGAFEMPPGWPGDGDYPSGAPVPSPLPPSLINSGGTLSLDINVQYYQQRRAHLAIYEDGGEKKEDWFLVHLAAPYSEGYFVGIESHGSFSPNLYMTTAGTLSGTFATRQAELSSAGVSTE